MYRAVALYCIEQGLFEGNRLDVEALQRHIDDIDITFVLNPETGAPRPFSTAGTSNVTFAAWPFPTR